jgi:hypothetical protein
MEFFFVSTVRASTGALACTSLAVSNRKDRRRREKEKEKEKEKEQEGQGSQRLSHVVAP